MTRTENTRIIDRLKQTALEKQEAEKMRKARQIITMAEKRLSEVFGHKVYISHNLNRRCAVVHNSDGQRKRISLKTVLDAVCAYYGVTKEQVCATKASGEAAKAKQMYCYMAWRHYKIGSQKEVAHEVNLTNHATVHHHTETLEGFMDIYPEKENAFLEIKSAIEGED